VPTPENTGAEERRRRGRGGNRHAGRCRERTGDVHGAYETMVRIGAYETMVRIGAYETMVRIGAYETMVRMRPV